MTNPKILELRHWSAEDLMGGFLQHGQWWVATEKIGHCQCVMFEDQWRPDDESTGQIWMVIRKMREALPDGSDGFNLNLNWQAHKGITISIAQFHKIDPFIHGQGADDNPCIAILLAAKEAWAQWATGSYRRGQ